MKYKVLWRSNIDLIASFRIQPKSSGFRELLPSLHSLIQSFNEHLMGTSNFQELPGTKKIEMNKLHSPAGEKLIIYHGLLHCMICC